MNADDVKRMSMLIATQLFAVAGAYLWPGLVHIDVARLIAAAVCAWISCWFGVALVERK